MLIIFGILAAGIVLGLFTSCTRMTPGLVQEFHLNRDTIFKTGLS